MRIDFDSVFEETVSFSHADWLLTHFVQRSNNNYQGGGYTQGYQQGRGVSACYCRASVIFAEYYLQRLGTICREDSCTLLSSMLFRDMGAHRLGVSRGEGMAAPIIRTAAWRQYDFICCL